MIIDSSAVLAILLDEPEAQAFVDAVQGEPASMSAATWVETHVVVDRRMPQVQSELDEVLSIIDPKLVDVSVVQARVARDAHRRFGFRSGSRARLNFGDCFAYALAITSGESLLFKGEDFTHTDVLSAL